MVERQRGSREPEVLARVRSAKLFTCVARLDAQMCEQ
jgi:hypothetical protein